MPAVLDSDSFGFLITDATRLYRAEFDRRIAAAGLGISPADARTLSHATRCGPIRQNLLAGRIGVEAMTVSESLDRLEGQGLVERGIDPSDRRAKLVHVTDAGAAMLGRIHEIAQSLWADASAGVTGSDWERFLQTLKSARDNLASLREQSRSGGVVA
ncbi:winged helix-turn-helix transcriptional regulator [Pseudaminobacter sp. 19-2017]|uniref:Winged helix-turn-helix transcriptional regulator n=1 Tax=Pseudaminobacter soli (ex Zhang et al. 2022) TaxID=2831468 RepID=A0A942DVQ7_9HYPH|nr:MarR family winged helix-turn-helix transcriptional regulator [Pseudaminobacter soli]MBS3647909.1 winged helix-turn-helix transcriptional regulator [Pseudaminobacter soli]